MSAFWSMWIIGLTLLTIVGVSWILLANRKSSGSGPDTTTGHNYDGIEEYDNPLPAWWFYMFAITIVFAIGYLIAFPGMGAFKGVLHWSSAGQLQSDVAKADAQYGPLFAKYASMPITEVANYVVTLSGRSADAKLADAGKAKFAMYCIGCHGVDGKGNQQIGAPNLTDDVWLYGGSPLMIQQTVRSGRNNAMPTWIDRLGAERVHLLAAYVYSLSHAQ